MSKFVKGHTRGFKKGQSGNPGGKSKAQAAAEGQLREKLTDLALSGVSPVEIMLVTMRDLWAEATTADGRPVIAKRMQAVAIAKDVAPYVHPRLASASVEATGKDGAPLFQAVVQYHLPNNGRDALPAPDLTE